MSRANSRRKQKSYFEMNADELAEATREFDREDLSDPQPVPPDMARRWKRAKAKRGRPKKGKGAKVISVSVEQSLLERSDALARKMGLTRAGLIERGLKAVLAVQEGE